MTLFDIYVNEILSENIELNVLRPVVEKEILHHEILSVLSGESMLKNLVFMGGTCLRDCYGSQRLSEDLDFAANRDFSKSDFIFLKDKLEDRLKNKYGFTVDVHEPKKDKSDTNTWKIRVDTRPGKPHLPAQKIHIDICSIPALDPVPSLLINHYKGDLGTSSLILQVETREEILSDKYIAMALRPNRLKFRDIWDMVWLERQGIILKLNHITKKLDLRKIDFNDFTNCLEERSLSLNQLHKEFLREIGRFLPLHVVKDSLSQKDWWVIACRTISSQVSKICEHVRNS
jgi:predicted nucleotidyltransferase component of viral defense system